MKRFISIFLIICISILTFTACSGNDNDKQLAEELAKKEATEYYNDNFKNKTISGVKYSYCTVSIKDSEFKGGKYIITVNVSANISDGKYSVTTNLMKIEYAIKVNNNKATVISTEYID